VVRKCSKRNIPQSTIPIARLESGDSPPRLGLSRPFQSFLSEPFPHRLLHELRFAKMAPPRRLSYYIFFAAFFLFVFYQWRPSSTPAIPHNVHSSPAKDASQGFGSTTTTHQKLQWKNIPVKNTVSSYISLPTGSPLTLPKVQAEFEKPTNIELELRNTRQGEVRKAFLKCWKSYTKEAWLKDELNPMSRGFKQTFGGWAATLIDSLDTLWIMGLKEEFKTAVAAVSELDFSTSTLETVNVFETMIRHLGGLIAAYDLSGEKALLEKAVEVADMLYVAFDTPNRMPITRWKWESAAMGNVQVADSFVLIAEIGSLTMEFTRLSQLTGDPKWYDAVARIVEVLEQQQNSTLLPGMWPISVNAKNKDFTYDTAFTLAAMADSAYEYLPKMYALFGGIVENYRWMYQAAMQTAYEHTIYRPMTPEKDDILVAGFARAHKDAKPVLDPQLQHLGCFAGGMYALGGRLFNITEHVAIGKRLTQGCIYAYKALPHGIMPEVSRLVPCPSKAECEWNEDEWKKQLLKQLKLQPTDDAARAIDQNRLPKGFTEIQDRRYILRPEAIESVFIMYRITGEQAYQAAAWDMFMAVEKHTATDFANAAIQDVTASSSHPPKYDSMEVSFSPTSAPHRSGSIA
jgi:mannosyl-oligosaccharide alpha-1,2-mannosidase